MTQPVTRNPAKPTVAAAPRAASASSVITSVETAIFRVQHDQADSGDNNIAGSDIIDAERMVGTNVYQNSNSRADLIIEDVRIADGLKTNTPIQTITPKNKHTILPIPNTIKST